MTDLHALIRRMADELDHYRQLLTDDRTERHPLATEARAALAEPQGEGPTRDEAVAIYSEVMAVHDCQTIGDMAEHFAHAVLAGWGNHPGSPDSSTQPH